MAEPSTDDADSTDSTPAATAVPNVAALAPRDGHTVEVLVGVQDRIGRIHLNRPKAINALTAPMVRAITDQLTAWRDDHEVLGVVIDGAGDRGLCAGGDVRALREAAVAGDAGVARRFFESEYAMNRLIGDYPKPYLAWMDGVVMGGGVGVSAHGSHRIVTERTKIAMPETGIGFYPDVGGLYFLANAPGELGTYAALTGVPLTGADAVLLGLADRLVGSDEFDEIYAEFAATGEVTLGVIDAPAPLTDQQGWIDTCFAGDDAAAILARLQDRPEPEAQQAAKVLQTRSPFSLAVTLEALRRAEHMTRHQVLDQDIRLASFYADNADFSEGVRALLVDKDKNPQWRHGSVSEVTKAEVLAAFGE